MLKLLVALALIGLAGCSYEDRNFLSGTLKKENLGYDRSKMPFDLRPIANYIGLWTLEGITGRVIELPPPEQIDYAINPIPKFGARAVNVT